MDTRGPRNRFARAWWREIGEELKLSEGPDFQVSLAPPVHLEFIDFSESTQTRTRYIMELFRVELSAGADATVESNSENRWLTEAEMDAGQTRDGQPVSATMKRLLGEVERES